MSLPTCHAKVINLGHPWVPHPRAGELQSPTEISAPQIFLPAAGGYGEIKAAQTVSGNLESVSTLEESLSTLQGSTLNCTRRVRPEHLGNLRQGLWRTVSWEMELSCPRRPGGGSQPGTFHPWLPRNAHGIARETPRAPHLHHTPRQASSLIREESHPLFAYLLSSDVQNRSRTLPAC